MASEVAHKFIVVEGPIGVGKTSLARRLCDSLSAQGVFEQAAQNPFLERFYRNPRAGALPTQLYFLFQRAQQLAALNQQDLFAPVRVADYLLEKDRLFARITLDEAEYGLYEQVQARASERGLRTLLPRVRGGAAADRQCGVHRPDYQPARLR